MSDPQDDHLFDPGPADDSGEQRGYWSPGTGRASRAPLLRNVQLRKSMLAELQRRAGRRAISDPKYEPHQLIREFCELAVRLADEYRRPQFSRVGANAKGRSTPYEVAHVTLRHWLGDYGRTPDGWSMQLAWVLDNFENALAVWRGRRPPHRQAVIPESMLNEDDETPVLAGHDWVGENAMIGAPAHPCS